MNGFIDPVPALATKMPSRGISPPSHGEQLGDGGRVGDVGGVGFDVLALSGAFLELFGRTTRGAHGLAPPATTFPPDSTKASAMAAPMPLLAPVTTAHCPVRSACSGVVVGSHLVHVSPAGPAGRLDVPGSPAGGSRGSPFGTSGRRPRAWSRGSTALANSSRLLHPISGGSPPISGWNQSSASSPKETARSTHWSGVTTAKASLDLRSSTDCAGG